MDPNKFMKLGEHIDIEIDGKQYKTDVQDIEKDGICVSQPMLRQAPVYMPQHAEIKVVYYRPDGMFEFMATNMGPAEHPTVRMIRLKILGEPRKYQRRMSFRIPLRIPVAVVVQSELTRTARTVTSFQTESIDLSESGMGIYAPQSYPLEARVRVDFYITLEGAQEQPDERRGALYVAAKDG